MIINYWKLKLKSANRRIDLTSQMEKIKHQLPPEVQRTIETTTVSAKAALETEKQNQALLFQHHWELRDEHMKELEKGSTDKKKNKEAAEIKAVRSREQMRRNFVILRQTFGEMRSKGISQLEIHDSDNPGKYKE
jgi:hypothetical protein